MEFREGQVLLFKGSSIFSKLIYIANKINYGTKGYSHAAIIGEIKKYSIIVYEALNQGFVKSEYGITELNNLIKEKKVIVGTPTGPLNNVKYNCEKYLGKPYAWIDIFHIGIFTLFGKTKFMFSSKGKSLICSEAVTRILYDASNKNLNFEKEFGKKYDLITPYDLFLSKQIKWHQ